MDLKSGMSRDSDTDVRGVPYTPPIVDNGLGVCPFCGEDECLRDTIAIVNDDGYKEIEKTVRCGNCGVRFLMDGEDFNKREGDNEYNDKK